MPVPGPDIADYAQDVKMMMLFNSKERTLGEFINIRFVQTSIHSFYEPSEVTRISSSRAGLTFERLWDGGRTSLIQLKVSS